MSEPCVLHVEGGARIAVPATLGCLSTYILLEQEDWFEDEIRFVRRWLRQGMQAVDAGSNIGAYTIAMAKAVGSSGRVWAFEPTPAAAELLRQSIGLNRFDNVTVCRTAVSDRDGTIAFTAGTDTELNAVAKPGSVRGEVVEVQAVTLDRMAAEYGWTAVDFVKFDVEGHEFEAVSGAAGFLRSNSPLVMLEIRVGNSIDLRAVKKLAELGYELYRLLPGPLWLAPCDPAAVDAADLLNVFACRPDRARSIAAAGLLVQAGAARDGRPSVEDLHEHVRRLPYAQDLAGHWLGATGPDPGRAAYVEGLAAYARSRDESRSPGERHAWLRHAFSGVASALEAAPSLSRLVSYGRLAWDLALRAASVRALGTAYGRLGIEAGQALAEPFLAPSESHESIRPDRGGIEWLQCSVVEQFEKIRYYSSVFAGTTSLEVLAPVRGMTRSAEMERRWQLTRMTHGMQAAPEPSAVLRERSAANLNPEYWRGGFSVVVR